MEKYKPITIIFCKVDILDLTKIHIALIILLKSELNMSNKLKVYLNTTKNVLIDVNPQIDIPLSLVEFTDMINYLMNKMKIKDEKGTVLMSIIKNNINDNLPPNTFKYKLNVKGKKFLYDENIKSYAFFINANEDDQDDVETVRISDFKIDCIGISCKLTSLF